MWRDRRQSQYCYAMINIHTSYVEQAATLSFDDHDDDRTVLTPIPWL